MTDRTLFVSSRGEAPAAGFSAAVLQGLAPDGGLYVPVSWPRLAPSDFEANDLASVAVRLLAPFVAGDPLAPLLGSIAAEAFDFPAPLVALPGQGRVSVIELFHGPTAAFKDFGARFLAACFAGLRGCGERALTILVATSGDTGGAVAAAFHERPGVEVAVLFPKGLVSPTQERQLTCWGGNVRSLAVRGTFDDCQRLVKQAFLDEELNARSVLSSANSINPGRRDWRYAPAPSRRSRRPGLSGERRMVSAAERRHAGFGHGRRQSEQPGAPARVVSAPRGAAQRGQCLLGYG